MLWLTELYTSTLYLRDAGLCIEEEELYRCIVFKVGDALYVEPEKKQNNIYY